jgi:hypothetical protein
VLAQLVRYMGSIGVGDEQIRALRHARMVGGARLLVDESAMSEQRPVPVGAR